MNQSDDKFLQAILEAARVWEMAWGITAQISPDVVDIIAPDDRMTLITSGECWSLMKERADWMDWMPVYYYYDSGLCTVYINVNIVSPFWGNHIKTRRIKNDLIITELKTTMVSRTTVHEFREAAL